MTVSQSVSQSASQPASQPVILSHLALTTQMGLTAIFLLYNGTFWFSVMVRLS
jgi:hypothetical protein